MGPWHTSEFSARCVRAAALTIEGKADPIIQTAMLRGAVVANAISAVHETDDWRSPTGPFLMGVSQFDAEIDASPTQHVSEAAQKYKHGGGLERDACEIIACYQNRLGRLFQKCELIGTELPITGMIKMPNGSTHQFDSHIDLLIRDHQDVFGSGGDVIVIDHKCWGELRSKESITWHYTVRLPQVPMYLEMIRSGASVGLGSGMYWQIEGSVAGCYLNMDALRPFKRKVVRELYTGETVEFAAGDQRPISDAMHWCPDTDMDRNRLLRQLQSRIRLLSEGSDYAPMSVDPVGCMVCRSREWCT